MQNQSALLARLEKTAIRMAEESGLEYIDTELVKEPSGRFLRIYVDKTGGVTLDELEVFHKQIRSFADDIDYDYMEVSSPGADRPLKKPGDFERAMGKTVELKLYSPLNGQKQFMGALTAFENGHIHLDINGTDTVFEQKAVALVRPFVDVDQELAQNTDI